MPCKTLLSILSSCPTVANSHRPLDGGFSDRRSRALRVDRLCAQSASTSTAAATPGTSAANAASGTARTVPKSTRAARVSRNGGVTCLRLAPFKRQTDWGASRAVSAHAVPLWLWARHLYWAVLWHRSASAPAHARAVHGRVARNAAQSAAGRDRGRLQHDRRHRWRYQRLDQPVGAAARDPIRAERPGRVQAAQASRSDLVREPKAHKLWAGEFARQADSPQRLQQPGWLSQGTRAASGECAAA